LPTLDQVAGIYSVQREECGRFFIDQRGAFFKDEGGVEIQFVLWDSGGEKLRAPEVTQTQASADEFRLTYDELLEMVDRGAERRDKEGKALVHASPFSIRN
jgi:hypothetical protein